MNRAETYVACGDSHHRCGCLDHKRLANIADPRRDSLLRFSAIRAFGDVIRLTARRDTCHVGEERTCTYL